MLLQPNREMRDRVRKHSAKTLLIGVELCSHPNQPKRGWIDHSCAKPRGLKVHILQASRVKGMKEGTSDGLLESRYAEEEH